MSDPLAAQIVHALEAEDAWGAGQSAPHGCLRVVEAVLREASASTTTVDLDPVFAECEKSLNWIARESFVVDYSVIKRGAGGLEPVVEHSTAMHALLFVKQALRDALARAAQSAVCGAIVPTGTGSTTCRRKAGHSGVHCTVLPSTPARS